MFPLNSWLLTYCCCYMHNPNPIQWQYICRSQEVFSFFLHLLPHLNSHFLFETNMCASTSSRSFLVRWYQQCRGQRKHTGLTPAKIWESWSEKQLVTMSFGGRVSVCSLKSKRGSNMYDRAESSVIRFMIFSAVIWNEFVQFIYDGNEVKLLKAYF